MNSGPLLAWLTVRVSAPRSLDLPGLPVPADALRPEIMVTLLVEMLSPVRLRMSPELPLLRLVVRVLRFGVGTEARVLLVQERTKLIMVVIGRLSPLVTLLWAMRTALLFRDLRKLLW